MGSLSKRCGIPSDCYIISPGGCKPEPVATVELSTAALGAPACHALAMRGSQGGEQPTFSLHRGNGNEKKKKMYAALHRVHIRRAVMLQVKPWLRRQQIFGIHCHREIGRCGKAGKLTVL